MFRVAPLFLFIFLTSPLLSDPAGKITGKVTDNKTGSPVEADIKLFSSSDNSLVKGTKSNADGSFSLENLSTGSYKLEASLMEYSTLLVENISLTSGQSLSFDTLKLKKQDVSTEEILVEDKKKEMELSSDKKTFNVDKSILTKGGTALDVLKKLPMIDIDINDNVSLRGSQNVKILVDDKPSKFVSLKQVPGDAIEKVEIITNPPAKYEAEGVTGIINIIMKKTDKLGFTGNVSSGLEYTQKPTGWGGLELNFKKKKFTWLSSVYGGNWNNDFSFEARTKYFEPVSGLYNYSTGNNHGYWIWGQASLDYEVSPGMNIGFDGSSGNGKWNNLDNPRTDILNASGIMDSYFTQNNNRNGTWMSINSSIYFNRKIDDKGREWTGDITLTRILNNNRFSSLKTDYDNAGNQTSVFPLDQKDTTVLSSYVVSGQTDYVHPLGISKLEAGYKATIRLADNNIGSDTLNFNTNSYVENLSVNNRFKLNEFINAVYGVFSSSIGNFSYKLGLRVEHTKTKGELVNAGQTVDRNYFDFFPSVSMSQKIGTANQLSLSYSRRITRPNIWRMNPFVNKVNPKYYFGGNPYIKPEYTDSYELSFMLITPVVTVTPMLFYRHSKDLISNYSYLIDSNITFATFRNSSASNAYGLDLFVSSRALGWVNLTGNLSLYNTKFDEDNALDVAQEEGFSWKANLRSSFSFGAVNVELYYTYTGEKLNFQGKNIPTSNFDIGISRSFMKDALSVSLKVSDVFRKSTFGQDISASGYTTVMRHISNQRRFSLDLSYKFGNTDEKYQKKRKVKQNSNEKSDQQDGNGR